jgi:hypothetical protein
MAITSAKAIRQIRYCSSVAAIHLVEETSIVSRRISGIIEVCSTLRRIPTTTVTFTPLRMGLNRVRKMSTSTIWPAFRKSSGIKVESYPDVFGASEELAGGFVLED